MAATPEERLVVRMEATLARFENQMKRGVQVAREKSQEIERRTGNLKFGFSSQGGMQAAGQSFSQMMQSISAGTRPVNAFSMQLADMTMMFGPLGMAIGAVAGVSLPLLVNALGGADDALSDLQEDLDALRASMKDYNATAQEAASTDWVERFGPNATQARRLAEATRDLAKARSEAQLAGAAEGIAGALEGSFSGADAAALRAEAATLARIGELRREARAAELAGDLDTMMARADAIRQLQEQERTTTDLRDRMTELARVMGADSADAAADLAIALGDVERADNPDDKLRAWQNVRREFLALVQENGRLSELGEEIWQHIVASEQAALDLYAVDLEGQMKGAADNAKDLATFLRDAHQRAFEMSRLGPLQPYLQYQDSRAQAGPAVPTRLTDAAPEGLVALIRASEGTASERGYNTTLAHGKYRPEGSDAEAQAITTMTLRQILDLQRRMLSDPRNRADNGEPSSALGVGQFTATTLFGSHFTGESSHGGGLFSELGLSWDQRLDVGTQDRLVDQLIRRRLNQPGDTVQNLREEWEGLQRVPVGLIEQALSASTTGSGAAGISPVDPEVQAANDRLASDALQAIERAEADAARERERAAKEAADEAERLLDLREDLRDTAQRAVDDASFEAALVGKSAEETARLRAEYTLLNEARAAGIDLTEKIAGSEETYGQMILRTAEAVGAAAVAQERLTEVQDEVLARQEFLNSQYDSFVSGLTQAIVAGEGFDAVLKNLVASMAQATLQAALFGSGPFGGQSGSGLLGGFLGPLFGADSFDGGGYTGDGMRAGGLDGKGGFPAILHPRETVIDHTRGQGGGSAEVAVRVYVDDEDRLRAMVDRRSGVAVSRGLRTYDATLPGRVKAISRDERVR